MPTKADQNVVSILRRDSGLQLPKAFDALTVDVSLTYGQKKKKKKTAKYNLEQVFLFHTTWDEFLVR